jgi:hypothetical protein
MAILSRSGRVAIWFGLSESGTGSCRVGFRTSGLSRQADAVMDLSSAAPQRLDLGKRLVDHRMPAMYRRLLAVRLSAPIVNRGRPDSVREEIKSAFWNRRGTSSPNRCNISRFGEPRTSRFSQAVPCVAIATKCLSADRQFSKSQVPSKLSLLPAQQHGLRGQGRYP